MSVATLAPLPPETANVLALGSDAGDIEIGWGATMLAVTTHPDIEVTSVVFGARGEREREARERERSYPDFRGGSARQA